MKENKKIISQKEFKRYFIYITEFDKNMLIKVAIQKEVLVNYVSNEFLPITQMKNFIDFHIQRF